MNWEYLLYGDWPSGIIIVAVVAIVCWAYIKLKDVKWPWKKF
jgi:hypothetical protein